MSTDEIPDRVALLGDDLYRIGAYARRASDYLNSKGWEVKKILYTKDALRQFLTQSFGGLLSSLTYFVLTIPESITDQDLGLIKASHAWAKFLFVFKENISSELKRDLEIQDNHWISFKKAPPSQELEGALEFCMEEAKQYSCSISFQQAKGIVSLVGMNLNYLASEIYKLCILSPNGGNIPTQHLRVLVPLEAGSVSNMLDSLARKDIKSVSFYFRSLRQRSTGFPVWICRYASKVLIQWVDIFRYLSLGISEIEISRIMGVHSWVIGNKIKPMMRVWTASGLLDVQKSFAIAERGVFSGAMSPWGLLETNLYQAFDDVVS